MTRSTIAVRLGALALAVSACTASPGAVDIPDSDDSPRAFDEFGTECGPGDMAAAPQYYQDVTVVDRIGSDELVALVMSADTDDHGTLVAQEVPEQMTPSRVFVGRNSATELRRLPPGEEVLVASQETDDGAWIVFVAIEDDAGDLTFAGECGDLFEGHLTDYRDAAREGEALVDVFEAVISDDAAWSDYSDWDSGSGVHASRSFDDVAPDRRVLDPEVMPDVLSERLSRFNLSIVVPGSWFGIEGAALCTLVMEGWNTCTAVNDDVAIDGAIPMSGWANDGEVIEVWLIDSINGGIQDPVVLIGTIELPGGRDVTAGARVDGGDSATFEGVAAATLSLVPAG